MTPTYIPGIWCQGVVDATTGTGFRAIVRPLAFHVECGTLCGMAENAPLDTALVPVSPAPVPAEGTVYRTGWFIQPGQPNPNPAIYPEDPEDEKLLRVLGAVAEGKMGFRAACEAEGWSSVLVRQWAFRDCPPGFKALYQEARKIEMDGFQDELMAVGRGDHRDEADAKTPGAVYRDQLLTKIMQWRMTRQAPEQFGERGAVDESGKAIPKQVIVVGGQTITF